MKIYLDNNLGVTNVEQEELTQDTIGYNILKVYIPNAVLTHYDTFTCYYGALLQNGRKVGWFAMEARTNTDADYEAKYTLYKATLEQCVVSVEGKVYIGCQVLLGNSGNATLIKKNTAVVQFNVRKSVAINNDILVLDTDQTTTDVLESYKNLLKNALTTYATKATTYTKTEVNSALALKADKSDTYTKTEVNGKLALKADKATTYNKDEVDTKDLNLAGQIAGARVELNNRINTTDGILNATQAEVAKLKSVQNVVEVVATKSALNSYDTTKLDVNDKVQVIADETHSGASTIYNWNGSAWQYVGAFGGNSYTKAETYNKTQIDSALSDKADKSDTYTRAVIDSMILTLSTDKADKSTTYTKTEIDGKFEEVGQAFEIVGNEVLKKADKSTAITHTGNQLKDYSGNNIYPNLDAKTQAKIDNAYGPAYVGKDTSAHILAFTTNKGIYIGTDTGHWYYWDNNQYVDGGVYLSNEYPSKFEVDVLNNFTNHSFISGSSGQQASYHPGLGASEYINIIKNSIVTIYRDLTIVDDRGISFYDATKTPIQSFTYTSSNKQIFVAPDNAYYVRFTIEFDDFSEDLSTLHTRATIQYQPNDVGKAINFTRNEIDFSNTSEFKISNDIGLLTAFRKVGVIGDSLASGQCVDSNGVGHDYYEYSWGQYLARATNNTYYNFSKGGMTTGMWLTDSMGAPLAFDGNHDCQAYIIGLGVNDAYLQLPAGTINDIHLEDYTLNPDTFYGNYGRIIQMIKHYYPKAKIFLLTMPQHYEGHNDRIRDIAKLFNENVYLVDLYNLMGDYFMNGGILAKCFRSGHYNAIGYYIISKMIASAINYIIHNNLDDFLKIEFINTNYN